jgi:hypothetical protein
LQKQFSVSHTEEVKFTQMHARENAYRDAAQFKNGTCVLLQFLEPGQLVKVLSLSPAQESQPEIPETIAA